MTWLDAVEDGIPEIKGKYGSLFLIPCEICGSEVARTQYSRNRNYICGYCKGVLVKKEKIIIEHLTIAETQGESRFNRAVQNIKKQVKDFQCYEKAINAAKKRMERYGSVPEAMVAIELLKNKYKIIPQQKIGKYKVDFALPDQKKIIEVDGELYHRNVYKGDREATIQIMMGFDWKIIHIPAELIAKDIIRLNTIIKSTN